MSRTNIENIYPLAPMQQGMLFDTLYAAGSGVYFVQIAWTLRGGLDAPAFVRAWQEVTSRHAILRTGFAWERLEKPVQVVRKKVALPVHEEDLRALSPDEQNQRLAAFAEEDRKRGFDLGKPPLMRIALFRLSEDTYRFLWGRHHLLLDGWSTPILVKEVFALYAAFTKGEAPRLAVPRPFGDYITWLGKQDEARSLAFWREQLAGFSAPTSLRIDRPSPGEPRHEERRLTLSEELSARLTAFVRERKITLSTLVQGAWAILLSRYSGEHDVLFGATVSGRSAPVPGIDAMIGMFINTLPVRVSVPGDEVVGAWLDRLHHLELALRDHEHSALIDVQGASGVPRGIPLFETLVVFENYPVEEALKQGSSSLAVTDSRTVERSNVPLTLLAVLRRALTLTVSHDVERFAPAAIDRMLAQLATILEGIVADASRSLADVPILSEAERRRVLVENNATAHDHPTDRLMHEVFAAQAARTPSAVALRFEGRDVSYRELDERSNQLAHALRERGIGPDVLVGVFCERSVEMLVALYGVLKAGGAYVPLDPEYPKDRLAFMLEDAAPSVILTHSPVAERLPSSSAALIELDSEWETIATQPTTRVPRGDLALGHLAYVIYTSGSTGKPKGAMNEHRGILNRIHWMQRAYDLTERDVVVQKTPYSFDVSLSELFWPLMFGARLVIAKPEGHRDPGYLAELIQREGVTMLHFVPSMLAVFLEEPSAGGCTSIARVMASGEALSPALADRFFAKLSHAELHNLYGPTEAAIDVTAWACKPGSEVVPIGRPIHNVRMYILDGRLSPVPIGVAGDLYIAGVQVGRGYLNRAELTAERFIRDPFASDEHGRMYKTGDVARWREDGAIEYLGRSDFQVKIRGFRIELGEIEAALLRHASVREAVVVAREDVPGSKRLVAYLVVGEAPEAADLRALLTSELPDYMVPSAFVVLDALPLTASGKVDRKALPAPEAASVPAVPRVSPRGPVEEAVASIFAEVLHVPPADVGAHDGFFELGGHSLLATQAISRVRTALGADLPLRAIFDASTVAELAAEIEKALGAPLASSLPPITRAPRADRVALSFGQ